MSAEITFTIDNAQAEQAIAAIIAGTKHEGVARFGVMFFQTERSNTMGELTVTDESGPITATVTFVDAKGAPATPDSTPTWTSSDESVATVAASEDGMSATVTVGTPGVTIIEASEQETDAETGIVTAVVAQGTLTVQPGDAVIGSVEFS